MSDTEDKPRRLVVTPAEAAEALSVSMPTIYAMIHRRENRLPSFRYGRKILIPIAGLQDFIRRQSIDD